MFKKLLSKINVFKIIIVELYIVLAQLIWHLKEYLYKLANIQIKSIPYYVYNTGIAVSLTAILIALIIKLKNPINSKKEEKIMLDIGLKNRNGEIPKLKRIYNNPDKENGVIYRYISKNIPKSKFEEFNDELERAYDINIYSMREIPGKNKYIDIYCVPKIFDKLKEFKISEEDKFMDNFIHELIVGGTRSGKTFYAKGKIAKVSLNLELNEHEEVEIFISDYKNEDFLEFKNKANYYGYIEAVDGINKVYEIMNERAKSGENSSNYSTIILLIDEYSTLLASLKKDKANEIKDNVASLLRMGASKKIKVMVIDQGGYSDIFQGARLNFKSIIGFSQMSSSQVDMLFKDYKSQMKEINKQGEAYLWEDGNPELTRVRVVKYSEDDEKIINTVIGNSMGKDK